MDHGAALKAFLTEISEGAKFLTFDYKSNSEYTIHLRCKVENNQTKPFYNEYSKQWLLKFSKFTSTNWIVRSSYPHIQRMLFRKLYFCQRSQFNKKEQDLSKRNVGCKAKIDFKVRIMTKHTEKKDPLTRQGCNLSIFIQFIHSHSLFDSESLSYLKTYSGVDSTFCKYFREGMGPVVARNFHNLALIAQYGKNSKEVSSKATNPTIYHVVYLQGKIKGKEAELLSTNEILTEKKHYLETEGFKVNIEKENYILISPLMKRVYSNFKSDNLLIDTTQVNADFVTIIYVCTKIGALPIASAVHSTKSEEDLTKLITTIKEMIEKDTEKELKLDYVMATDIDGLFNMTYTVTPRYAIISELWNDVSKMPKKQRRKIIELLSSMLISDTPDAEKYYEELKKEYDDPVLSRIEQLWYDKQFSCDIFDNFYVSVRIIKQFLTMKCKFFNTTILIDVLANILENYWRQIVIAHCKNRDLTSVYSAFLTNDEVEEKDTKTIWFCDCNEGLKGEFCAHLIAQVEETMKVDLNPEDIELLLQTAGEEGHSNIDTGYEFNLDVKNETEDGAIEEEMDQTEVEDNNFYVEVKNEDSYDPLDSSEARPSFEVPIQPDDFKKALHTLNAEFYRLNKAFRANPNESNIDTMMRLAKELSKIQPGDNSGGFEDNSDG